MPYPVILNGDHAEFERENASTKPEDRPDWPLPSFDAVDWAKAFCKTFGFYAPYDKMRAVDEDVMVTWFANALMRGFDERASRGFKCQSCDTPLSRDCPSCRRAWES